MPTVLLGDDTVSLKGDLPSENEQAPDFTFVKDDFSEGTLYEYGDKTKVILAVLSMDTGVCQAETRRFNEELGKRNNVVGLVISKDLPFAMKRVCENDGIDSIISASDFRYNDFGDKYNVVMIDGNLKGTFSRAVFVVDGSNTVRHSQLVPAVGTEPDYEAALAAVDTIG